jgi:hypothetical protein
MEMPSKGWTLGISIATNIEATILKKSNYNSIPERK